MECKRNNNYILLMDGCKRDFAARNLSLQIGMLKSLLNTFENPSNDEKEYVIESLKRVEKGLKKLRGFLND